MKKALTISMLFLLLANISLLAQNAIYSLSVSEVFNLSLEEMLGAKVKVSTTVPINGFNLPSTLLVFQKSKSKINGVLFKHALSPKK